MTGMLAVLGQLSALLGVLGVAFAGPPSTLDEAHRREVQLLTQEREALERAIADAEASGAAAEAALEKDIDRLTVELTQLQAELEGATPTMPDRERARALETQARHIDETRSQMQRWLARHGIETPSLSGEDADVPALVSAVLAAIARRGELRLEPQAQVFDVSGHARQTDVLQIGRVAAVEWTDSGGSAVPFVETPEGLQALEGVHGNRAVSGEGQRVRVVLFDPESPPASDAFVETGWRAKFEAGGELMWVLLAFACLAALVAVERVAVLAWNTLRWRRVLARFEGSLGESTPIRAARMRAEGSVVAAPLRAVAEADEHDRSSLEERATQAILVLRERLNRRLSLMGLVAGVAPLTGLLGTVTGMIATFDVVTTQGTSDPQSLAGGISIALLTTQFGLAIAIPTVIIHALLVRGSRRLIASVEQTVLLYIHGPERAEVSAPDEVAGAPRVSSVDTGRLATVDDA